MKKLIALFIITVSAYATYAQCEKTCEKPCDRPCEKVCDRPCEKPCDMRSCGPKETKKQEAAVTTTLKSDLQPVNTKMCTSSLTINRRMKDMTIEKETGAKNYKPSASSTKSPMAANNKIEIQLPATQAEKL